MKTQTKQAKSIFDVKVMNAECEWVCECEHEHWAHTHSQCASEIARLFALSHTGRAFAHALTCYTMIIKINGKRSCKQPVLAHHICLSNLNDEFALYTRSLIIQRLLSLPLLPSFVFPPQTLIAWRFVNHLKCLFSFCFQRGDEVEEICVMEFKRHNMT